jgi:hypothetical protein
MQFSLGRCAAISGDFQTQTERERPAGKRKTLENQRFLRLSRVIDK